MGKVGAPKGNQNGSKGRIWRDALRKALARKEGNVEKGLRAIADQVVNAAIEGEFWAIKEIAERMDGKPAQQQIITGDEEGGPIKTNATILFVPAPLDEAD